MTSWRIIEGDCREALAALDTGSVHTVVTSPPYFGLRDYGHDRQIGLEATPEEFVGALVGVFREVRRVLRDDGTVWLNLGDSYAASPPGNVRGVSEKSGLAGADSDKYRATLMAGHATKRDTSRIPGIKKKDLIGVPWMVAFALRADGWYLRSDIVWHKPNPMPESVTDRPTKAHEYMFLLSKGPRYYYDADAIREGSTSEFRTGHTGRGQQDYAVASGGPNGNPQQDHSGWIGGTQGQRNKRSVWTVATHPFAGAHFATFPPDLIEPCILAGCPEGGTVLDPFAGAGTTGLVALRHGRSFIGIELNPEYAEMARERIRDDAPLLNVGAEAAEMTALQEARC